MKNIKKNDYPIQRIIILVFFIFLVSAVFVNAGVSEKNAKLIQAAEKGILKDVQTALTDGADINATSVKKYEGIFAKEVTALIVASENGHAEIVKFLLDKGASLSVNRIPDGITASMLAAENGHAQVVKILLDRGADVNAKKTEKVTALIMASEKGHTDVVKLLLDKGADVNVKRDIDGANALILSSEKGHTNIVKLLLDKGADVK